MRLEGWPLNRINVDRLAAFNAPPRLDRLSLAVALQKTNRSGATPGALQLSSDTQVQTLSQILNRIIRDMQMKAPPRSVLYRNLTLDFRVEKGKIVNDAPWLNLGGLQILSSPNLALEGNIRLYGGRNGEKTELRYLLHALVAK